MINKRPGIQQRLAYFDLALEWGNGEGRSFVVIENIRIATTFNQLGHNVDMLHVTRGKKWRPFFTVGLNQISSNFYQ